MHMTATTIGDKYHAQLTTALDHCIKDTNFHFSTCHRGKVRDTYDCGDHLVMIATDRLSAFDRMITHIPYKGAVLTLSSRWWFEQTEDIVPNHLLAVPDANVMIVKKCHVFPVEFVMRGYLTGSTNTSLWTLYQAGVREVGGVRLPEGMQQHQPLIQPLLTPTTKSAQHDHPVTPEDIITQGWMSAAEWEEASAIAHQLFARGTQLAAARGFTLVDTKYEFGRDMDGRLMLVDEIHTPDASRYWLRDANTTLSTDVHEHFDKEMLRLWLREHCDPYKDAVLPAIPAALIVKVAQRYLHFYESLTGCDFPFPKGPLSTQQRILRNIASYLA